MKKKEIQEYLDEVGSALVRMQAEPQKGCKLSAKEVKAIVVGASLGIAFGSVLTEGMVEPLSPEWDAIHIVEASIVALIDRKESDRG